MTVLSLLNPASWFSQGRSKLSGGPANEDRRDGAAGNYANRPVTLDTALQLSAFWAAVKLTAQTIGTLPLVLYRREADGSRVVARDHALHSVLRDAPNADQTAVEFWEGMAAWVLVAGNAYARIDRRSDGAIVALTPIRADQVSVARDQNGAREYRVADRGRTEVVPESRMFHLRGFGLAGDTGLSVIQYARQTLGSAMAAEEASGSTFANGMRPSGFFKAEVQGNGGMLTADQRRQAKEVLIDPYTGAGNTAKVGILEGPFTWLPTTLPAQDSQLLETRGFNVEDVCRWVGVPPILIGHASSGQTMWGSGVEQIMLGWLTLSLRAQLLRIQHSVNRALILPAERSSIYAEHMIDALLQADSTARGELYWKLAQLAAMTPNQIAQKENWPTFPGGDVRLVNSTLVPLDKAGQDRVSTKGGGRDAGLPFDERKAFNPAKHPRDKNGMFAGRGGHGRNVGRMVRRSRADPAHNDVVDLGRVDGTRFSAAAGRDVEGWRFGLRSETVRHIHKTHGSAATERARGQKPITADDYTSLGRVTGRGAVSAGELSRGRRLQTVVVEHESRGARLTAVFEVQPRRKTLALLTMFKR